MKRDSELIKYEDTMSCPFCGEPIKRNAVKCKHCGEWLDASHKTDSNDQQINVVVNNDSAKADDDSGCFGCIFESVGIFVVAVIVLGLLDYWGII